MEPSNLKKRLPITDLERKNIRKRQREHPSTYPQLIAWYADQPGGRALTGGRISKILSKEYEKLDSDLDDRGRISVIKALEQLGKDILAEKQARSTQSLIAGWLTNTN
jgi:hypothetical protein